mmetsp:Transcript_113137/g.200615  ORF Transcript_113137/g.200615 Transcript_113137/m.200615 type:complete len:132 (-) Transcript_113137:2-397(-)
MFLPQRLAPISAQPRGRPMCPELHAEMESMARPLASRATVDKTASVGDTVAVIDKLPWRVSAVGEECTDGMLLGLYETLNAEAPVNSAKLTASICIVKQPRRCAGFNKQTTKVVTLECPQDKLEPMGCMKL